MKVFLKPYILLLSFLAVILLLISFFLFYPKIAQQNIIKVGLLFPTTGPIANSGKPALNAALLAIDKINKQGGIKNQKIVPVIYNPGSDWNLYAQLAKRLILQDRVKVIVGCIASASRKMVKPVVEQYDSLLIYPTAYEGIEDSKNIIYIGQIPNQQIVPAVSLMIQEGFKSFYIVGSDYIYSHVASEIISHEVNTQGGKILGVSYVPFGQKQLDEVIKRIQLTKPDAVFNLIAGEDNVDFFKKINQIPSRPPVISFNIVNDDIVKINRSNMIGDYFAWSYYPELKNEENKLFLQAYLKKYGSIAGVDENSINAYKSIFLWQQGVEQAPDSFPTIVRDFMLRASVGSPSGIIYIDPISGHAWRTTIISKMGKDGQFNTVWDSSNPIQPIVYPAFKTKAEWELFEYQLYLGWGDSWGSK